jgi:hypothetical protein
MNHKDRIIRIDDEHNLEEPPAESCTPDEISLIALNERIWIAGAANHFFSFLG